MGKCAAIASEKIAEARHLYEQTSASMADIARLLGISRDTLRKRVKEWGWNRHAAKSGSRRTKQPRNEKSPQLANHPPVPEERLALAARVQRAVEKELSLIESILASMGVPAPGETERTVRTLASLARTLREMTRLDAPHAPAEPDDDDAPYDLEELRRELARKLEALVAGRAGAAVCEP